MLVHSLIWKSTFSSHFVWNIVVAPVSLLINKIVVRKVTFQMNRHFLNKFLIENGIRYHKNEDFSTPLNF